jgi:peptidoglycan/LPS O-acetylase OafA/YrhL/SAM-dependent methyltransferase
VASAEARVAAGTEAAAQPVSHPRRVGNLDVLRGLTAFGILAIHAYSLGGRNAPIRAQYWYDVPLLWLASGVWMFFAISGYVIAKPFVDALATGRPLPRLVPYALRRMFRIYPLYWIALTAVIVIAGVDNARPWQLVFHYALYNNLIPRQQESVFSTAWTLTVEVVFYTVLPLLALGLRRVRRLTPEWIAAAVLLSWLASIAFTIAADLSGDGSTSLWLRDSFFSMWQAFCPGILLALAPHLRSQRWRRRLLELPTRPPAMAAVAVLTVVGVLVSALAPLRFGVDVYQLLVDLTRVVFSIAYGMIIAAGLSARPWSRHGRWILELGLASYAVYLIHPVVALVMARHGLVPVHSDSFGGYVANTAVLAAVTIPLALASWRWLEQPAIALGRRLGRSVGGTSAAPAAGPGAAPAAGTEIRRFWNARAREDALYFVDTRRRYRDPDPSDFGDAEGIVELLLSELGVELGPRDTVLEIGCGVGRLTRRLAARAGRVVALDVSDEMLSRARELGADFANVSWRLGDGVSLAGIEDASIDACVSTVVFQHVPDAAITLGYIRELGRVLCDGGWAALQVSNDPSVHRPRDPLRHRALALLGRAPRGQRHPAWLGSWVAIDDVREAAADGGLELQRVWGEGTQYCQLLLRRRARHS